MLLEWLSPQKKTNFATTCLNKSDSDRLETFIDFNLFIGLVD